MVVKQDPGGTLITMGSNQYLQPDYTSSSDTKISPLALLQQTCSQIGNDSMPSVKQLTGTTHDKHKKQQQNDNNNASKSPSASSSASSISSLSSYSSTSSSNSAVSATTKPPKTTSINDNNTRHHLAFKPYEATVLTKCEDRLSANKSNNSAISSDDNRNRVKLNSPDNNNNNKNNVINNNNNNNNSLNVENNTDNKSENGKISPSECKTGSPPIDASSDVYTQQRRTGLEIMLGHAKDLSVNGTAGSPPAATSPTTYKTNGYNLNSMIPSSCCPPQTPNGIETFQSQYGMNPALRQSYTTTPPSFSTQHANILAAVASGYSPLPDPSTTSNTVGNSNSTNNNSNSNNNNNNTNNNNNSSVNNSKNNNNSSSSVNNNNNNNNSGHTSPYAVSYARVKNPAGGEQIIPVCKDPYCTGCQLSAHNQQMLLGVQCPAGCTQCEQHKYNLTLAAMSQLHSQSLLAPGHPYAPRPYLCNWIIGDTYCGKRFNTSDELYQHYRTHTANLSDPSIAAAILASVNQQHHHHQQQQQQLAMFHNPLLSPFFSQSAMAAMHRSMYPTNFSQLNPLAAAAARYHPYGSKPTGTSLPPTSYPPAYPAFYPSYPMYASAAHHQRLSAAAVHP